MSKSAFSLISPGSGNSCTPAAAAFRGRVPPGVLMSCGSEIAQITQQSSLITAPVAQVLAAPATV